MSRSLILLGWLLGCGVQAQDLTQLMEAGKFEAALPLATQQVVEQEKILGPNSPDLAAYLLRRGNILRALNRYAEAEPLYQRAIALREKSTAQDLAEALNSLAVLYRVQARYPEAETLYLRALAIQEQKLGPDHRDLAKILNNLANLYWQQGNYAPAETLHRRALGILEKNLGPDHPKVAIALNNLAVLSEDQGNYTQAETLHRRALAIRQKALDANHPDVADSLHNLADLYAKEGKLAQAEPLYQQALTIRETALGPEHLDVALSLGGVARLYRVQGRFSESEQLHQRVLSILTAKLGPDHPELALSLSNLALLYIAQGDLPRAQTTLERSLDIQERYLTLVLSTGSEQRKQDYLATLSRSTATALTLYPSAPRLALTTVLQRKGRILDALSKSWQTLREQVGPQEQALIDELNRTRTQLAALVYAGSASERLQAQAEQLEAALSRRSSRLRAELTPITVAAVQAALPLEAVLIEIVRYRPVHAQAPEPQRFGTARYAAALLKATGEPRWLDLGEAAPLEQLVKQFRQAIGQPSRAQGGQQLAKRLLQPLYPHLGKARLLLIAPDGPLNLLPWAALPSGQGLLLDRYTVSYLGSGRDLVRLQNQPASRQPPLIFANPTFGTSSTQGLSYRPLPGTAAEGAALQRLIPQARLLTGAQATEARFKAVHGPSLLHLATHGFFLPTRQGNPLLRSGLALAGFNARAKDGEDGVLTALEVSGLDLQGTQLAVLSACDTGLGTILDGEGVYGLRRAFSIAGVRSQVISLWKVDDLSTRFLMEQYYRNLLSGQERSMALQKAQQKLRRTTPYRHPYYWAAFIPSGDWRPLPNP